MLRLILVVLLAHSMLGCVSAPDQVVDVPKAPPEYAGDTLEQWLSWSEPDNGIAARIEYLIPPTAHDGGAVYLRLKNVGEKPITVPAGEIAGMDWVRCFELYRWVDGDWQPVFWPEQRWFRSSPDTAVLQPGQTTLLGLNTGLPEELMASTHIRISVCLPGTRLLEQVEAVEDESGPGFIADPDDAPLDRWVEGALTHSAAVITPPFPTRFSKEMDALRHGHYPSPDVWPFEVSDSEPGRLLGGMLMNGPTNPVHFNILLYSNYRRIRLLPLYNPEEVRAAMDRLLDKESDDPHWQMMVAALAARNGSERGRAFIHNALKEGGYQTTRSALAAVDFLLREEGPRPWAERVAIAAIDDPRVVLENEHSKWTVADLATGGLCDVVWALGRRKCIDAVPALIRRVEREEGEERGPIIALGEIGDPRATPILMQLLTQVLDEGWNPSYGDPSALSAITDLKPPEAVDLLIQHVDKEGVPEALGRIGDSRAIPALRPLGEAKNLEAMIALYRLGETRIRCALIKELYNPERDDLDRVDVVYSINDEKSQQSIELLRSLIRDDPSGMVTSIAIWALSNQKTPEAIDSLIDCFEIDFETKTSWKPAYESGHFQNHIAQSLERLTGQTFGNNPAAWRAWWEAEGRASFGKQ